MEKGTQQLATKLLSKIYSTATLSSVSENLETLTQNSTFKDHASDVVTDPHLTDSQKRTQILYLLRQGDSPVIYDFFADALTPDGLWLFHTDKIDYFDRFVQSFQRLTETVRVMHLSCAIPLSNEDIVTIATNFSKAFGYKLVISHEVDRTIIGGVQIRLENLVFDYSLRSRFLQFEHQWLSSVKNIGSSIEPQKPLSPPV